MKPIDFRNATWKDIQGTINGSRLRALNAWKKFGRVEVCRPGFDFYVRTGDQTGALVCEPCLTKGQGVCVKTLHPAPNQ